MKEITKWEPEDFQLEKTTTWNFSERGNWATHNGRYRGNWSPYVVRNIILRYSKERDIILDQFLGSGTTLIESLLTNRRGIGVEINPLVLNIAKESLRFEQNLFKKIALKSGDARNLGFIKNNSIDLIATHPPYGNIIRYSKNIRGDLSLLEISYFLKEMDKVARESYRVLKEKKFCAILIGDIRQKGNVIPLGFNIMNIFLKNKFILKEIIIKKQNNCKNTGLWEKKSMENNFLLLSHEYLFIFQK